MKKKLVTTMLALTITMTTMAGCGNSSSEENTATEYEEYCTDAEVDEVCEAAPESYSPSVDSSAATYESAGVGTASPGRSYNNSIAAATEEAAWDMEYDEYYPEYKYNTEDYTAREENEFTMVASNPLSTFAADVDTASYSNMRRMVEWGYGINDFPEGSIRAEEMINYFKYDYVKPKFGDNFGVDAKVARCPWNEDNMLLVMGITTEEMDSREKPASNIVFLVDVSGSMSDSNKLPLLKEAMGLMVDNLTKEDKVSIITYASGSQLILNGVDGSNHIKIKKAFNELEAGGSTNGEGGLIKAYQLAERHFIEGGNNRVIIASDGDFNVGATSKDDLTELITEKKESGIFLSTLGFGMGNYSDTTMETLADNGNGNYAYIDDLSEAKKVLVDEFESTLYTVAKDTKFQVEFNPALVNSYRLVGYENRQLAAKDFRDDTKDGGELGSGRQITVMYEIELAGNGNDDGDLKYQSTNLSSKGKAGDEWCTLSVAYKEPDGEKSRYLEFPIGVNNVVKKPSEDFLFAADVAMLAMALNNSSSLKDFDRYEAVERINADVKEMNSNDELRSEFGYIVEQILENSNGNYYYYE